MIVYHFFVHSWFLLSTKTEMLSEIACLNLSLKFKHVWLILPCLFSMFRLAITIWTAFLSVNRVQAAVMSGAWNLWLREFLKKTSEELLNNWSVLRIKFQSIYLLIVTAVVQSRVNKYSFYDTALCLHKFLVSVSGHTCTSLFFSLKSQTPQDLL